MNMQKRTGNIFLFVQSVKMAKPVPILHKEQGHSALRFGPVISSPPAMPVGLGAKYDSLPLLKRCIHEAGRDSDTQRHP